MPCCTGKNKGDTVKETLHKARLTALHAICLQIFRHIAPKLLDIREYACVALAQSDEKSDYASYAQSLCSVDFIISQLHIKINILNSL